MGRTKAHLVYNNFVKGLITEASEINFPANASISEDNCVLLRQGNRRRRLGIDYAVGSTITTTNVSLPQAQSNTEYSYYKWKSPAGNTASIFDVFQIGNILFVYDSLSLTLINTVNLQPYIVAGTPPYCDKVRMIANRGKLFIVAGNIEPFFIAYTAPSTLTITALKIQTRDFEGLNDGLAIDNNPPILTNLHQYNLLNQGWYSTVAGDPLAAYYSAASLYPANNQIWYAAIDPTTGGFDYSLLSQESFGNTPAPKGHFIVNPFDYDPNAVSGLTGLPITTTTQRPSCVESFAGRVFYSGVEADGFSNILYFSHIIDLSVDNAANCYQIADPTAQNDSALVDDDGGYVVIADCGGIKALQVCGDTLLVFATNGIWGITGGLDVYFSATSYNVYQITDVELVSTDSVCLIEDKVIFCSPVGIYTLSRDSISGRFSMQTLTDTTIKSYYEQIPLNGLSTIQTIFDDHQRQVQFLWNNTGTLSYVKTNILVLDLNLQAFWTYSFSNLTENSPLVIGGIYNINQAGTTVDSYSGGSVPWYYTHLAYLTLVPAGTGVYNITFSSFNNTSFYDWDKASNGNGVTYSSYLETGYELAGEAIESKQIPYLIAFFEQTEKSWLPMNGGYELTPASSCTMQVKWEFANSISSSRWTDPQEIYRLQRLQLPDSTDLTFTYGQDVVITKNKIRGKGRAIRTRFNSKDGYDFHLLGWGISVTKDTDV